MSGAGEEVVPLDRRTRKTQERLRGALRELLVEFRYETISVRQIIERADVGRATFYDHYDNKADLTSDTIGHIFHGFTAVQVALGEETRQTVFPTGAFFEHIGIPDVEHIFRRPQAMEFFFEVARDEWAKQVTQNLVASGETYGHPPEILGAHIVGSVLAIARWWMDNKDQVGVAELSVVVDNLILSSLESSRV